MVCGSSTSWAEQWFATMAVTGIMDAGTLTPPSDGLGVTHASSISTAASGKRHLHQHHTHATGHGRAGGRVSEPFVEEKW
jgi:hypothetical protein